MPSRMIDPAFWQSESLAQHPIGTRYLFAGLFSNADDQGRLRAHPALLRSTIYPYDDIPLGEIQTMVESLAGPGGPIALYNVDGKDLIQIVNWWRWQHPPYAWPSKLPPPPGWTDRLCYRRGNTVVKENWDHCETASSDAAPLQPPQSGATVAPEWGQSGATVGPAPSNSSSGSISDSGREGAEAAGDENAPAAAVPALAACGIGEPRRSELAALPFMEAAYVMAWQAELGRRKKKPDDQVAYLIACLESGEWPTSTRLRPPARAAPADENRRRYIEGPYAGCIEH